MFSIQFFLLTFLFSIVFYPFYRYLRYDLQSKYKGDDVKSILIWLAPLLLAMIIAVVVAIVSYLLFN